jgi:hypothetical protein
MPNSNPENFIFCSGYRKRAIVLTGHLPAIRYLSFAFCHFEFPFFNDL